MKSGDLGESMDLFLSAPPLYQKPYIYVLFTKKTIQFP